MWQRVDRCHGGRTPLAVLRVVSTLIAWVVYRKLGVAFLRVAWFNLDWLWAGALVITGVLVVLS